MNRRVCAKTFLLLLLLSSAGLTGQKKILLKVSPRDSVEVAGIDSSGVLYLSLNEFASSLHINAIVNDTLRKLELRLPSHSVRFAAKNPFVVISDSAASSNVYQLPLSVLLRGRQYFVPLFPFVSLVGRLWPGGMSLDTAALEISLGAISTEPEFDITGLNIERKLNGYLIVIHAARRLSDVEKWQTADGWLFVTIANAKADTNSLKQSKLLGAVRQLLTFQSATSVQLTFRLSADVAQSEVINDAESNDLLISLRTLSPPEKEEIEKKRQLAIRENLDRERNHWKLDVIVIDAGHGGKDPGALGVNKTREKDVTLAIALRLGRLLERSLKGVRIVYTRKTDKFVELFRRPEIANEEGGKLFVSIHCNSMEQKPSRANGFEIYLLRPGKTEEAIAVAERENKAAQLEEGYKERYQQLTEESFILVTMRQSAYVKHSERFAEIAAEAMANHLKIKNSGVKQAGFYVLVGASMPNVLVETGYLSNKKEEKFLKSTEGQRKIAEALFAGIKEYKAIYEKTLKEGLGTMN